MKSLYAFMLALILLPACGGGPSTGAESVPTALPTAADVVDTEATVAVAIAATGTAVAVQNVTVADDDVVATAVAATIAAMPPTATPIPVATATEATLTEAELAALIDEAVTAAVVAAETSAEATTLAAGDETLTAEELQTLAYYLVGADEAVAVAIALLDVYEDLYGEMATAAISELAAMEDELAALNEQIALMNELLVQMDSSLTADLALAAESVAELEAVAETVEGVATEVQDNVDSWQEQVATAVANRTAQLNATLPQEVAVDLSGTVDQVRNYAAAARTALGDQRLSEGELQQIAQQSANAIASLQANGGPALQEVAGNIEALTGLLAGGAWGQAGNDLSNLEGIIASLPTGGGISLPRGGRP